MLNLDSRFKILLASLLAFVALSVSFVPQAFAESEAKPRNLSLSDIQSWHQFKLKIEDQEKADHRKGQAYMISGGLLVLGGLIGYHNAHDPVEKFAYSVSQSVGVAGIGYGAYLNFVDSDHSSFYQSIENSKSLSEANKDEIVRNYISNWKENQRAERLTRVATHTLIGAMNIYNGSRENDRDLRTGLFVLGGVNLLAALSLSFDF